MSSKWWLFLIIFSILLTRFWNLGWGNGFYFHPDENNMATAVSQLSPTDLNPHFFAYGQFPLYLAFFSLLPFTGFHPSFTFSVLALRFWSTIFSVIFLFFAYKLSKIILKTSSPRHFFLLLLIFNPGLIQIAHFGTTESILCTVFMAMLFYSLKIITSPRLSYFLLASIFTGIGLASKITALFFILPVFLAALFTKKYFYFVIYLLVTALLFFLLSPYNFIAFPDLLSALRYETGVATGSVPVFYTRQFLFTTPYLFQFTKIFPYVSGLPVFIISIFGLFAYIRKSRFSNNKSKKIWFIIIFSCLLYFLYFGFQFTKWTRFVSPVFFIFPLFAAYLFQFIKLKIIRFCLFFLCCLPGIFFWTHYLKPDIRQKASTDIIKLVPANSFILSESGNVVNLPLRGDFQITNFDFYDLDFNEDKVHQLSQIISSTDYILLPSRRVFKNQTSPFFPISGSYYYHLFNGSLGFNEISQWSSPDFILNSENAEETWTVFDRPTIRLFKKVHHLSEDQILNLLVYKP